MNFYIKNNSCWISLDKFIRPYKKVTKFETEELQKYYDCKKYTIICFAWFVIEIFEMI